MTEPTPERAKIQSLEGLRGIMAWWVVLGHLSLGFGWHLGLIDHNTLAVDVFIYLSGFVIFRMIDRKREPYAPYIVRRIMRIVPLYLVVLAVSTLMLPVQQAAWLGSPPTPTTLNRLKLIHETYQHLPAHLLVHAFLAQGLVPKSILPNVAFTLVGQAWSIALEMQFYVIAPALLWCLSGRRRLVLILVAIAGLVAVSPHFSVAFLGAKALQFGVGIATYLCLNRDGQREFWGTVAVGCGAVTIALDGVLEIVPLTIWLLVVASTASPTHSRRRWLSRALSHPHLVRNGEISYSIYMVHMLVIYTSIVILERLGLTASPLSIAMLIVTFAGTYILAWGTHRLIEKPADRVGRSVAGRLKRDPKLDLGSYRS